MTECQIKFKRLNDNAKLPSKNEGDIGWDLYCIGDEEFDRGIYLNSMSNEIIRYILYPHDRYIFQTGLASEITEGYHALVWSRSGLSTKHGIDVLAGVMDNSYRGEWMVCLHNDGDEAISINAGDKIAQFIVTPEIITEVEWTESLSETFRGIKGFGSSDTT